MSSTTLMLVAAGGAIGSALRYLIGLWTVRQFGATFPWHTLVVNIAGAFLLGVIVALTAGRGMAGVQWRLFLGVGMMGGFTTFSALSLESMELLANGAFASGALNILGSGVAGVAAVVAGLALGRAI